MTGPELVDSPDRLATLASHWRDVPEIGLDTEFVRTDTYFARPGLIQLNAHASIVLVDPIAIPDLGPLTALLAQEAVTKVFHSGAEDLSLLARLTGITPSGIADTQIAAAFCGHGPSLSYRALVKSRFGIEIAKGETRSDWCRRPLTEAQLGYAADDVRYLPELWRQLRSELDALGRGGWVKEEFATLVAPDSTPAYARVRGAAKLSRPELGILARLADWRERMAGELDRPRNRVVSDAALVAMALQRPTSRERLAALEDVSPRLVRRHGDALLALVANTDDPSDELPLPLQVTPPLRSLVDDLRAVVQQRADALALPPELIASRRMIEILVIAVAHHRPLEGHPLRRGWRAALLGAELEQRLHDALGPCGGLREQ